tara:strand:+ start:1121 stop:1351 length:231 start_codon:yes stop_codon:yes gene_type:complete
MTTVNITTNKNTVTVDESNSSVIEVATQGPQGASAADEINVDSAVDKSIVYYDGSSSSLKANNTWTTDTLTNGGNF